MYKRKTSFLGMPYIGPGDTLQSREEERRVKIIENQLRANTLGIMSCVIEEGEYSVIYDEQTGIYSVSLQGSGPNCAFRGVVNGCYVEAGPNGIVWPGLKDGYKHYLYIQWNDKVPEFPDKFHVFSRRFEQQNEKGIAIYIAKIDFTGNDEYVLDIYPEGKIYSNDLALHASMKINPHGQRLVQDILEVREGIKAHVTNNGKFGAVIHVRDDRVGEWPTIESEGEIRLRDKRIDISLSEERQENLKTRSKSIIGSINEIAERPNYVPIYMNALSNGKEGALLNIDSDMNILFVAVTRSAQADGMKEGTLGDVGILYSSESEELEPNEFVIFNSGDKGIEIQVIVFCLTAPAAEAVGFLATGIVNKSNE